MGGIVSGSRGRRALGCAVAVMAVAGCTSGTDTVAVPASSAAPSTSAAHTTGAVGTPSPGETAGVGEPAVTAVPSVTAEQQQSTPAPSPSGSLRAAVVKQIRVGRHAGFDRVVIEFDGTPGTWRSGYQPAVVEDPTGKKLVVAGTAFLVLTVQNATFDNAFQVDGTVRHLAYRGPKSITPTGLANVRQIMAAGDFEATLSIAVGVERRAGVRVARLENPSRLVLDIAG